MTVETDEAQAAEAAAQVQSVRRVFLLALALALLAGAVALVVELASHPSSSTADSSLLPTVFRQAGFADGALHLRQQATVPSSDRRHELHTTEGEGSVVYVVARCDRGRVTVRLGGLTSAAACTGRPVGLVRLTLAPGGAALVVTVDRPQRDDWAFGLYR